MGADQVKQTPKPESDMLMVVRSVVAVVGVGFGWTFCLWITAYLSADGRAAGNQPAALVAEGRWDLDAGLPVPPGMHLETRCDHLAFLYDYEDGGAPDGGPCSMRAVHFTVPDAGPGPWPLTLLTVCTPGLLGPCLSISGDYNDLPDGGMVIRAKIDPGLTLDMSDDAKRLLLQSAVPPRHLRP